MSGVWASARLSSSKPLREVTRTQFMCDSTHSGGRWRNCCNAWGSSRWTIGSRTSFRLSRDKVQRNRCRPGEPQHCLHNFRGIHPILAGQAAAILSFIVSRLVCGAKDAMNSRRLVHCLLLAPQTQDPTRTRCSLGPATLRAQAASRKSSDTALLEARTLLGASAGSSRIRLPGKPVRAVPSKNPMRFPLPKYQAQQRTFTGGEVQSGIGRRQQKRSMSRFLSADQDGKSSTGGGPSPRATHSTHPLRMPWNHHCDAREKSAERPGGPSQGVLE